MTQRNKIIRAKVGLVELAVTLSVGAPVRRAAFAALELTLAPEANRTDRTPLRRTRGESG